MSVPYAEVIGDPIKHSKSPLIHKFWIEQLGLSAEYRAHHVREGELADYLIGRREDPDWRGCNVTMPHKQTIMPLLDAISPEADAIGAVNTVVRQGDGSLTGFNTDAGGFLEPLLPSLKSQHLFRMARILGTGGAARAIIAALADQGFVLVVAGRNPDKAAALLEEFTPDAQNHAVPLSHFAEPTDFAFDDREGCLDLVINASPLGMEGAPPLDFDWSHAPPGSIAYDIVTSPIDTPFLNEAREAGHPTIDGYAMLIGQAARAFAMFFGEKASREADVALRERLLA